jgi:hypothetical protein
MRAARLCGNVTIAIEQDCLHTMGPTMTTIPQNPEALLTRDHTATALTEAGFPISRATLATKACRGGGPPYQLFGPRVVYRWGSSLDWAKGRLSEPRCSSSEGDTKSLRQPHDGALPSMGKEAQ